jgi:hypothetical protein
VRGLQQLDHDGRFRLMFFANDAPPRCGFEPSTDFFYDNGSHLFDRLYLRILGDGTPAVSSFDAFMHTRPSQMPNASGHSIGNANVVKTEVLFAFLRDRILPPLLPKTAE